MPESLDKVHKRRKLHHLLGKLSLLPLTLFQDSHWLEKYLNLEGFLIEKSLKVKTALKSTGKSLKSLVIR